MRLASATHLTPTALSVSVSTVSTCYVKLAAWFHGFAYRAILVGAGVQRIIRQPFVVMADMIAAQHDLQVLYSVVVLHPIAVVYQFVRSQLTAKMDGHEKTVFGDGRAPEYDSPITRLVFVACAGAISGSFRRVRAAPPLPAPIVHLTPLSFVQRLRAQRARFSHVVIVPPTRHSSNMAAA